MITLNTDQLDRLERMLHGLNATGVGFAIRDTNNDLAFETARNAKTMIRNGFVNRNTWTQRSVRVDRARRASEGAIVGSTEDYMREQELGARTGKGSGLNIPTPAAAGMSPRANVRTKVVRRANRMNVIKTKDRSRRSGGLSRKQQNIVALKQAKDEGRKFVYMDRGRVKGIYSVRGTKRRPKARMIQDLTRKVRVVTARPWLLPSSTAAATKRPQFYSRHIAQQLNRARGIL